MVLPPSSFIETQIVVEPIEGTLGTFFGAIFGENCGGIPITVSGGMSQEIPIAISEGISEGIYGIIPR